MTRPAEPDPDAGPRFVEGLLAGDPARLDVATDEEVEAMMAAADIEAAEPEDVEATLARGARIVRERAAAGAGAADPKVVPLGPRRTSRVAWAAAAVAAAGVAAVVGAEGRAIVARLEGHAPEIGPDRPGLGPSRAELASRMRDEAIAACRVGDYATCRAKLDDARALDPAGETEPRVVEARRELDVPPLVLPSSTPDKPGGR